MIFALADHLIPNEIPVECEGAGYGDLRLLGGTEEGCRLSRVRPILPHRNGIDPGEQFPGGQFRHVRNRHVSKATGFGEVARRNRKDNGPANIAIPASMLYHCAVSVEQFV